MSKKKIDRQIQDGCFGTYYSSNIKKVKEDKIVMSLLNDNELAAIDRFIDMYKKQINVRQVGMDTYRECTLADILRGAIFSCLGTGNDARDKTAADIAAYVVMRDNDGDI